MTLPDEVSREETEPLITVAMPVRNGERFIREAIESVLSQTFRSLRLFVSDNASTDATEAIVKSYASKDSRVQYIRQPENIGLAANLAFCLRSAKSRYVTFLPHDDFLDAEDALERAASVLESESAVAAVYSDMRYVDDQGRTLAVRRFDNSGLVDSFSIAKRSIITTRNQFGIPLLLRSELTKKLSFDERLTYAGDVDFCYASALGKSVFRIPEVLIANRFHSTNATRRSMIFARSQLLEFARKHNIPLSAKERLQNLAYAVLVFLQKQLFFTYINFRMWRRSP